MYAYFNDEKHKLHRCVAQITGHALSFSAKHKVEKAGAKTEDWAQISVVVDVENKQNILYVVKEGGKSALSAVKDKWDHVG